MPATIIPTPRRFPGMALPAVLAAMLILAMAACVPKKPAPEMVETVPPAVTVNPETLDVDTAYTQGMQAFWLGDFRTAATLFESLDKRVEDPVFKARALYGLACSLLAQAKSRDDMVAALAVWQKWQVISSGSTDLADPRMLTPFLRNSRLFPPAKDQREQKPQPPRPSVGDQDMARRLQEKEKQVQLLQKQIKALEAIHQEIQEKKKMSNQ